MSVFDFMHRAVDAAQMSSHPTSKVGACLYHPDFALFVVSPNFCPPLLAEKFDSAEKIGETSLTVHAETAALLKAKFPVEGAFMFSTDPPCPNCAKNMAEAGVKHLYIDHKGFKKVFAQTRREDFENLSLAVCQEAGISVTKVFRKEKREEVLLDRPDGFQNSASADFSIVSEGNFSPSKINLQTPWVAALCNNKGDNFFLVVPFFQGKSLESEGKYNFDRQPLNRLMMIAARKGWTVVPPLYSSRVPTTRELVNLIGAGFTELRVGNQEDARDDESRRAFEMFKNADVLRISDFSL